MDSMLSIKVISAFQHKTQIELPAAFFTDQQTVAAARGGTGWAIGGDSAGRRTDRAHLLVKPRHPVAAAAKVMSGSTRQHKIDSVCLPSGLDPGQSRSRMDSVVPDY
jgi:hypothetical protein